MKGLREFQKKGQAARKRPVNFESVRKRLEKLKSRSKPIGRNYRLLEQGANRSKETREFR